ncbi:hypothetical protein DFH08DRAFT_692185, partial [Mycena albidolilacea]
CTSLTSALPGKVSSPESARYEKQQGSYYSLTQSDLKPSCRASRTTADDVSHHRCCGQQ